MRNWHIESKKTLIKYNTNDIRLACGPLTRLQAKKQKAKQAKLNQKKDIVHIDANLTDLFERRNLRKKLLKTIFHKRNWDKIFDFDRWPQLQESDEQLKLVYMYIDGDSRIDDKKSVYGKQWKALKRKSPKLYKYAYSGKIWLGEHGILQMDKENELSNKIETVFIVPSILRGAIEF